MQVQVIRKGEDFPNLPNMYRNLEVCGILNFWQGFTLIYLVKQPTQLEINDIENATPEIRLFEYQKSIFLLSRFGDCGVDAPFDARLLSSEGKESLISIRSDLDSDPQIGISLTVYLVCSKTFKLLGIRMLGLQRDFSEKLYDLTLAQLGSTFNHNANVSHVYARNTPDQLFKRALPLQGFKLRVEYDEQS